MKKLALLAASLCSTPAWPTDFVVTWGVEQYNSCTAQDFDLTLASPTTGKAYLKRITGMVNGVASGVVDTNYMRAALVTFYSPALLRQTAPYAAPGPTPPGTFNQTVVNAFGAFVLKQTGSQSVSLPIDLQFAAPILLPNRSLHLHVVAQSYPNPAPSNECMDVEIQVSVMFSDQ
jgi:hypothetical protein